MQTTTIVAQLGIDKLKTYLFSIIFIAGNIVFPQLCHLIPNGGLTLLPIYFFTLVAAYKFGVNVGILTALGSPLLNHVLFGMPAAGMLALIMTKGLLLALVASAVARRMGRVTMPAIVFVVVANVVLGALAETMLNGGFLSAWNAVKISVPGLLCQIFGGYVLLKSL